jgi:hypothetical protein
MIVVVFPGLTVTDADWVAAETYAGLRAFAAVAVGIDILNWTDTPRALEEDLVGTDMLPCPPHPTERTASSALDNRTRAYIRNLLSSSY